MSDGATLPELAVVPAWNERENLELLLPALRETLEDLGVRGEIIVADGGSHDGTPEAAARPGAQVIRQRKPGYGAALREAIAASQVSYVVSMDAELSHRPTFIEDLWRHREEAEVLIASRYVPGGNSRTHWFRRLCRRILNITYARALSLPLHDISSGFRLCRPGILRNLDCRARDFDILEEILIKVHALGFRIRALPLWWVLEWIYRRILPGAYAHEHVTHFTRQELARRLCAAGYEVLDCRHAGFCEMIFRARKREAKLEGDHD